GAAGATATAGKSAATAAGIGAARSQAAAALASMRRDLFPRAAAYQPEIAS
ncbi:hypothetical protein GTP56_25040, partial [Duganella sp. FT134W]|nr:hypothetical protein [Duganella margarita]